MTTLVTRKFTVEQFHRMIQCGVFPEDDRIELIHGEIAEMSPIGPSHAACVKRGNRLFSEALRARCVVSVQDPVQLDDRSAPQPDLALLVSREDFYASALPRPRDVLLAVEVSDSSLEYDRTVKIPLYAAAGIAEAWIVDLAALAIEVHTGPRRTGYAQVRTVRGEEAIRLVAFPDVSILASEVLGP